MAADLRQDAIQVLHRIQSQFDSALGASNQADAPAAPSPAAVTLQIGSLSDSLRLLLSRKLVGSLESDEVGQISERMKALQAYVDGLPPSDAVTLEVKGKVTLLRSIFLQVQNARVDAAKGGVSLLESSAQRGPIAPAPSGEQPHDTQLPSAAIAKGMLGRFVAQYGRAVVTEGDDQKIIDVKIDKVDDLIKTLEAMYQNNLGTQFSTDDIGELESRLAAIVNYSQSFENPNRRILALQSRVQSLRRAFSIIVQTAGH